MQGKPNTHAWERSHPHNFSLFFSCSGTGPPPSTTSTTTLHLLTVGWYVPRHGPIRYRAYRLPYSRHVSSTFKCLITCTTHCGLCTFSLNRWGRNHKYHPMTPPVNLMIAVCGQPVKTYNLARGRKPLDFYRS